MSETPSSIDNSAAEKKVTYSAIRLTVLFFAFLLILINPFLNYYFHFTFIQGWYQSLGIGSLWFVSPLEGVESLLITRSVYMPSLVGMVIPFILAFLLGRVFCSWICPVTFILELFDRLRRFITKKQFLYNKLLIAKKVLWFTLIAELIVSMILGAPIFVFLSPPGLVGREIMMLVFFKTLAIEGILLIIILLLELLTRRFFCRSFCPLGGMLALIGKRRRLKVGINEAVCISCGKCTQTCPMGLVPEKGESTTAYCWNCADCVDICPTNALSFSWISYQPQTEITTAGSAQPHPKPIEPGKNID